MHSEPKKNREKGFQSSNRYFPVSSSSMTNQNSVIQQNSANFSTLNEQTSSIIRSYERSDHRILLMSDILLEMLDIVII